jgi:hypothetical protein
MAAVTWRAFSAIAVAAFLLGSAPTVQGQAHSKLQVSAPDQRVQLTFTLDGDSKRELQQSLDECKAVEVRYIAELRKQRMLWPDLSFARTTVRNRALCDGKSHSRTLQRRVDGSIVATATEMNQAAVLAFMSETGEVSAFQGVTFPSNSYSVRVKSVLVTESDRVGQTGVLAEAHFEIR